jgi:hypothetical protein
MPEYEVTRTITLTHRVEAASAEQTREQVEYTPIEWQRAETEIDIEQVSDDGASG